MSHKLVKGVEYKSIEKVKKEDLTNYCPKFCIRAPRSSVDEQSKDHQSSEMLQIVNDYFELMRILYPTNIYLDFTYAPSDVDEAGEVRIPYGVVVSGAPLMWQKGYHGEGIKIGIIDSGVAPHPDLTHRIKVQRNFTTEDGPVTRVHGTHVAGTIAADGNLRGIAYKADVYDYRTLNNRGTANYRTIADAIYSAASECHVINLSLAGSVDDSVLRDAIKFAYNNGVIIVAAVGNSGDGRDDTDEIGYPASYPETIAVGSADYNGENTKPSFFSNSSRFVDCCSQGENVLSTSLSANYEILSGSSMASPHVTGMFALILQEAIETSQSTRPEDIYHKLLSYAKDIHVSGKDNSSGHGFVTFNDSLINIPKQD